MPIDNYHGFIGRALNDTSDPFSTLWKQPVGCTAGLQTVFFCQSITKPILENNPPAEESRRTFSTTSFGALLHTTALAIHLPCRLEAPSHHLHPSAACHAQRQLLKMDAAAIRSCIVATLDADANVRKRAELQLKQVRTTACAVASLPALLLFAISYCSFGPSFMTSTATPTRQRSDPHSHL